MPGLFTTPIPPEKDLVQLEAREVVVDLFDRPHLLTRLTLTGPHFPHRSAAPHLTVGETRSKFVRISEDGLRADAYFDEPLPEGGQIVLGWGGSVDLIFPEPFRREVVRKLDRERLKRAHPSIVIPAGV
jgi:hypothetical protein